MILHHVSINDVSMYLGLVVEFEMRDGTFITGRVVAVDEWNLYLSRTRHHTVALNDIKQITKHPF